MRTRSTGLALVAALGLSCEGESFELDCRRPLMIGHRGTINYRPESTLTAFGGDGIEIDLRFTADGHLVAMHDSTIDRTTSGSGPVSQWPLAKLQALDAGSWFDATYGDQFVPTFEQVVEFAEPYQKLYMLDIRSGDVLDAALDEVLRLGIEARTLVAVWEHELLTPVCEHESGVRAIMFVTDLDQIPQPAPECLEVIRLRGFDGDATEMAKDIVGLGFESMVGGWSVEWGYTRWGIADSLHRQMPWLEGQRAASCAEGE